MTNEISVPNGDLPIETELLKQCEEKLANLPTIRSHDDYTLHSVAGEEAAKLLSEHEKRRKNLVKPVNDAVKQLNAQFKEAVAGVKKLADESKAKRFAFDRAEQKRAQARLDKRDDGEGEVAQVKQATRVIGGTAKYVAVKKFAITDLVKVIQAFPPQGELVGAAALDDYISTLKKHLREHVEFGKVIDGMAIVEEKQLRDR